MAGNGPLRSDNLEIDRSQLSGKVSYHTISLHKQYRIVDPHETPVSTPSL